MSVARRFEFVISPFLIIDLAKISAFPSFDERSLWVPGLAHQPLLQTVFEPITVTSLFSNSIFHQAIKSGQF